MKAKCPAILRGTEFVHGGKAWRAESSSFDAGGSAGTVVLARRLEWVSEHEEQVRAGGYTVPARARSYGVTKPMPVVEVKVVNFENGSIFDPDDPAVADFGLFDRANAEILEDAP